MPRNDDMTESAAGGQAPEEPGAEAPNGQGAPTPEDETGAESEAGDGQRDDNDCHGDAGAEGDADDGQGETGAEAPTAPLEKGAPTEVRPFLDIDETARRPAQAGAGSGDGGAAGGLGQRIARRAGKLASLAGRHRVAVVAVVAVALVALVSAALLAFGALADASDLPSDELVAQDAAKRVTAPPYSPGSYGGDGVLVFRGIEVIARDRVDAIEGAPSEGADAFATVTVIATFSSGSMRAEKSAVLGFARVGGSWVAAGSEEGGTTAWHALSGVDQGRVLAGMSSLLSRAGDSGGEAGPSLSGIYSGGTFEVVEEEFDEGAQSDRLVISCSRTDGFVSYSCELAATFTLRPASGQWELVDATASEGATTPSLDAVVGTWSGTFQSQSTEGTRCLAAREGGLEVVVTGYDAAGATPTITGSVTGIAHYHAHPSSDAASCEGDLAVADVPFTARLVSDEGGLTFSATLPQDVDGTLELTLRFGTEERPDEVEAVLKTTYPHTKTVIFFPVEETLTYEDVFLLNRA